MAWPNFSETTFAFAMLQEMKEKYGARSFYVDFLTQPQEATKGGYDASVNLDGTIHYFQFKRSEVMSTYNAKELKGGGFASPPVYRMHLRSKDSFKQHKDLIAFEGGGHSVLYAASGAENADRLKFQFFTKSIISHAGFMVPSEIILPNYTQDHHASFKSNLPNFRVYSEEGFGQERKVPTEEIFVQITKERRRSADANWAELKTLVGGRQPALFAGGPESLLVRAALWAQMRYDCHLTFFPAEPI